MHCQSLEYQYCKQVTVLVVTRASLFINICSRLKAVRGPGEVVFGFLLQQNREVEVFGTSARILYLEDRHALCVLCGVLFFAFEPQDYFKLKFFFGQSHS